RLASCWPTVENSGQRLRENSGAGNATREAASAASAREIPDDHVRIGRLPIDPGPGLWLLANKRTSALRLHENSLVAGQKCPGADQQSGGEFNARELDRGNTTGMSVSPTPRGRVYEGHRPPIHQDHQWHVTIYHSRLPTRLHVAS